MPEFRFHTALLILVFVYAVDFGKAFGGENIQFSGNLYPFYQSGVSKNLNTGGLGSHIELQSKLDETWRTLFEFKAEKDFEKTDESFSEIANGYLEWRGEANKFKVGWQTVEWEGTDILNLADVINSKNYTRPFNPIPRASPSLRLTQEWGSWEFDALFIPHKSANLYPNKKSYWLPRGRKIVLESEKTDVIIPEDIQYELKESEILGEADKNNGAARISYRGSAFDFNLFGFEGSNFSATLVLDGVPIEVDPQTKIQLTSPVIVRPLEYRQKVLGAGITKPFLDTWILRLSSSVTSPVGIDPRLPKQQNAMVASLEKSLEVLKKSLIVSVGCYEVKRNEVNQLTFLRSVFEKAYSLSGRFEFSDDSTWLGAFIYDSIGKSQLFHIEWDYRISGQVSFGLSSDQFSGPAETLLGSYDRFDFYKTRLKWSF